MSDPVRLLSQGDDTYAASLLKSARDGDAAAARSHKVAVLGAAGGAAIGGAALAAAKLSSKGVYAVLWSKWLAIGLVAAGGLGVTSAALWARSGAPASDAGVLAPAASQAAVSQGAGAPASDGREGPRAQANGPDAPSATERAAGGSERAAGSPDDARGHAKAGSTNHDPAAHAGGSAGASGAEAAHDIAPASANGASGANGTSAANGANGASAARGAPAGNGASGTEPGAAAGAPAASSDAASALSEEVAALRAAREALGRGQAQKCLDAVNAYFARFPSGHMGAEARLLRIEAMFAGGQKAQAAALASAMLAQNPRSPYAPRLRAIAGEDGAPKQQ